ncbi:MAG: recombinase family protein [Deltaproteobacteria bacterium]|nr:recombinase family protein [Deltaproteobacteria bacterium]
MRRSKNDEGKQQFSLDVQAGGCRDFLDASPFAGAKVLEYVDDGKAGDDFHSRTGLRQLLGDARRGDIVLCRDQSRLGRDAIEVTLVVRDLVRDRGCRLFYYASGQEALFANAIDQATTFIQGTGHQMELEAIRSRVREALRSRVRAGRVAGGRCYGYRLERQSDGSGRPFTIAVVHEAEAAVVRRIFRLRCEGHGLKKIAHVLNRDAVPSPNAGKRGTGSWSPGCIRAMLLNGRYRGVYTHGKVKKVRTGGVVARVRAEASEVISVEIPEWQIIDDETWARSRELFAPESAARKMTKPAAKYALTGIARCGTCGGAVGCASTRSAGDYVKSYTCVRHHQRGPRACTASVRQPMAEIEGALVSYLEQHVLSTEVIDDFAQQVRAAIEEQIPERAADVAELEGQLRAVKAEQKKLTKAVAIADDVPELVSELRDRATRARSLESRIAAARRAPEEQGEIVAKAETLVRRRLCEVRDQLRGREDLRTVFLRLFPEGIRFYPSRAENQQVWRIEGGVSLGQLVEGDGLPLCTLQSDPKGT